jgi:thymidylate synthase ThyX
VKSSRYCTKQNPDDIKVELSQSDIVNAMLIRHTDEIIKLIKQNPRLGNDDLKLLLPQGFIYKGQVQFNVQSLQHFIKLRLSTSAHFHIVDVAQALLNEIPKDLQYLFIDVAK